jgi:hypothetical protein
MTTSLNAVKACAGCAQAKRKCGKQHPRCTRCARKGLACGYARWPAYVVFSSRDDEARLWEDLLLPGDFDVSSAAADLPIFLPSAEPFADVVTSEDVTPPPPAIDLLPRLAPPVVAFPNLRSDWSVGKTFIEVDTLYS